MRDDVLETSLSRSLGNHALFGLAAVAILVIGLGGWSVFTNVSGAVIAPGAVVVETSVKRVQHSEGGIIKEIGVDDGDLVEAGDLLVRLDDTIVRASLQIVRTRLDQLTGLEARLEAERTGATEIAWPSRLGDRKDQPDIVVIMESQKALIASRRASIEGRRTQIEEQIRQINTQVEGLTALRDAKAEEIEIIERELADLAGLQEQGLVRVTRLNELQRERARLRGEHGRLVSDIARARETISERRIQMLQIVDDFNAEVLEELQQTRTEIGELAEREIAALDRLARIDILAPRDGIVHNLAMHTIGGVVSAGETIVEIVPKQDRLVIEARIAPDDVDQILTGQSASVRFPGLNQRTTPELEATVLWVSPDLVRDRDAQTEYYRARLELGAGELEKVGLKALVPGMPVESFIRTTERSVFSYFIKPLTDQIAHTFRES